MAEELTKLQKHIDRIGPDGVYRYRIEPVAFAILHAAKMPDVLGQIAPVLEEALRNNGNRLVEVNDEKGPIPPDTDAALRFEDFESRHMRPDLLLRFPKTKGGRPLSKVIYSSNTNTAIIPDESERTHWGRQYCGAKKAEIGILFEASDSDPGISPGSRAMIASLEGNVGEEIYKEGEEKDFFKRVAKRTAFTAKAEMVNRRHKVENPNVTFGRWASLPEVQELRSAVSMFAEAGLLWDIDMGQYLPPLEAGAVLYTMKQAGYGEGQESNLVNLNGEWIMAISETGESKTNLDPLKGNAVPVPAITEDGHVHWLLKGFPKGHPINVYRHPSRQSLSDLRDFIYKNALRGNLGRMFWALLLGKEVLTDNPPSIETFENGILYHIGALLENEEINGSGENAFEEALKYLFNQFQKSKFLPIIPKGFKPGINALAHIHGMASFDQEDKKVFIEEVDLSELGFPHTPSCGSFESVLAALRGIVNLYYRFGLMNSIEEIRGVRIRGHGSILFGNNGILNLAKGVVSRVNFERTSDGRLLVPKY
ncbi:hypothetical protein A3B40_05090 [Candidatus Roizmanbacteria bacterium RIFCSPLOWO2_01_FULL_37_16]|uniref:Uncharacterized protein n=1 Tax=Candidatus Roizmanbacteria bacterium RIFCSPLOWO2_01_FULL_37_16 TaxID=1802058 RepID=A0A1F7IN81_9BACT|nr:MAG: hypothetical protein A3B40_05090 [Candidatus Roizmanbacteria bacterium RIFCSPLOWO2_01_FULL_37_16]